MAMLEEQMQVMSVVWDTTESFLDDMAKLLRAFDDQKREQSKPRGSGEQKGESSAAEHGKHLVAKRIRNTLTKVEDADHEYHVLQETIVPDTCVWAFREPEWERWLNQQDLPNTVLAITGSPGTSKSHLAFSVYQALRSEKAARDSSRRTCVAQFYFREQNESLSSFANGVISAINRVAEQSPELCEALYAETVRDESQINQGSSDDLLRKLLGVAFGKDSNGRLFLVLDGVDEIAANDLALFGSDFNVQESSSKPPLNIEIAREKQMMDLRTIIWARINSLSALKKFSRYVQQRVADKTEEIAPIKIRSSGPRPSFFDIVNTLEREGAVLRSLEKPLPRTLYQLYEVTTAECFRWTESRHHELEKVQRTSQSDDLYQDGKLAIKFRERSMRGFFREEPVAPNDGHRPRRSEAHRQMFLTCCNFIQPEHPGIMGTDKGVREYAVNYVPHHWRHIEAEHLKSSFARIPEEELKIAFYNDEKFDDSFFDRLLSWAGLLPDVEVALNTEATEWWTLVVERLRDCLLQHAKLHVRRLQDAVDVNTTEASFSAANVSLKICGKGTILEEQARESFASTFGDISGALSAKQAVVGLDVPARTAESTCLKAMTYSQTTLERVQSLELLSRIRTKGNPQAAYEDIQACLRQVHDESVPLTLRRSVYTTKAQIETKLGRRQDAAASYDLAGSIDPSNLVAGDGLRAQIKPFEKEPGKQEFIRTLKTWSPLERPEYLC
ncbi:hypothetical protein CCHR01_14234 [Colletotrichum chrysophilum]|uniref:Nephrocystin 3-like N-terminal domain-containing protein n=1 Tax=Colletotrichum chrysophilum TaxID=1836956 RepID=A0AAD9A7Y6_9PEZI|nr:hypothetical protein CCHR01_14234 [Colletotrichum chrysophilum]